MLAEPKSILTKPKTLPAETTKMLAEPKTIMGESKKVLSSHETSAIKRKGTLEKNETEKTSPPPNKKSKVIQKRGRKRKTAGIKKDENKLQIQNLEENQNVEKKQKFDDTDTDLVISE